MPGTFDRKMGSAGQTRQDAVPGPDDVLRRTLPNGITVLARENWSAPSAVVEGCLYGGTFDEPDELPGLATFTSSMLSRGTRGRSFAEINEAVESVGGAIGYSVDRYTTGFSTKSLVEDLDLILAILADELRDPIFPAEHVDRLRGLRLTAIAEQENDTRHMASRAFRKLLYGSHPFGRDPMGDRESNARIDRDAITEFYRGNFGPQGMVVSIVGAMTAEDAVRRVEAVFADWTGAHRPRVTAPPVGALKEVRRATVAMPDKSQSDIYLGWPAMRRLDPDFEAARLANTILGVFGLMGRLGENVRERSGMAYYAYSRLSADRESGVWLTMAGVSPTNVDRAVDAMLAEVARLCDEPVPEEEIEDSKRYLTGSLPLRLETNDGVASLLVDMEFEGLGLDYLLRYPSIINALTADDIQRAARRYLDASTYALAVAGPP